MLTRSSTGTVRAEALLTIVRNLVHFPFPGREEKSSRQSLNEVASELCWNLNIVFLLRLYGVHYYL